MRLDQFKDLLNILLRRIGIERVYLPQDLKFDQTFQEITLSSDQTAVFLTASGMQGESAVTEPAPESIIAYA